MTLAREMGWSYRECCDRVDSQELSKWKAFDRLNPIDRTRRIEVAIGTLTAHVVASAGGKATRATEFINDYFAAEVDRLEKAAPPIEAADVNQDALWSKIDSVFGF